MLIIAGVFEVDPAQRAAFIDERVAMMKRSRSEPGCIAYAFMTDPVEAGRVYLFERWESKEALAQHIATLRADPPSFAVAPISAETQQYEIGAVGPIGS